MTMAHPKSREWYEYQRNSDDLARDSAESMLGAEFEAYTDAMSLIVECIDYALGANSANDLAERYKVGIAVHGFNLLWSAWDDALTGRFGVALGQGRIIYESTAFLTGLRSNPNLANEIESGQVKVKAALRAIRKAKNDESPGTGSQWFAEHTSGDSPLHDFAHFSRFAMKSGWGTVTRDGKVYGYARPGGVLTPHTLRRTACVLAGAANEFLHALVYALQDNENVQALWQSSGKAICERNLEEAREQMLRLRSPRGPLDFLHIQSGWRREDQGI